jgi:hypothetical protein
LTFAFIRRCQAWSGLPFRRRQARRCWPHNSSSTARSGGRKHPHGERSNYVRAYMSAMMVGSVVEVPFGKYDALDIQSSSTSAAHKMWDKGSVTTTINRPTGVVEIMRIL